MMRSLAAAVGLLLVTSGALAQQSPEEIAALQEWAAKMPKTSGTVCIVNGKLIDPESLPAGAVMCWMADAEIRQQLIDIENKLCALRSVANSNTAFGDCP